MTIEDLKLKYKSYPVSVNLFDKDQLKITLDNFIGEYISNLTLTQDNSVIKKKPIDKPEDISDVQNDISINKKMKTFKRSFFYDNIKIFIGLSSLIISIVLSMTVNFIGFKESKNFLLILVILYILINLFYTILDSYIKKNKIIFENFEIHTELDDNGTYLIMVIYVKESNLLPKKYTCNICDLFYEDGKMDFGYFIENLSKKLNEIII